MADTPQGRQALHDQWQKKIEFARLRLNFARAFVQEVREDLQTGAIPSPDGDYAYLRAVRAETAARAEYRRLLGLFSGLLYRNQIPEDPEPHGELCAEKQKLDERLQAIAEEISQLNRAQLQHAGVTGRQHYKATTTRLREAHQRQEALLSEYRKHLRQHRC